MEWNISKSSSQCTSCERIFLEEECFFSTLYLQTDYLLRKDFCLECWKGQDSCSFFSFWKTRTPKKEEPRRRLVDNVAIQNLFLRLQEVTEPWAKNMQYVLGLYLLRKKLLKLREQGRDEQGDFMTLYSPDGDRTYLIYNPNLTEEEIEKINNDVLRLLDPTAERDTSIPLRHPASDGMPSPC